MLPTDSPMSAVNVDGVLNIPIVRAAAGQPSGSSGNSDDSRTFRSEHGSVQIKRTLFCATTMTVFYLAVVAPPFFGKRKAKTAPPQIWCPPSLENLLHQRKKIISSIFLLLSLTLLFVHQPAHTTNLFFSMANFTPKNDFSSRKLTAVRCTVSLASGSRPIRMPRRKLTRSKNEKFAMSRQRFV